MASPSAKYSCSAKSTTAVTATATHAVRAPSTRARTAGINTKAVAMRFKVIRRSIPESGRKKRTGMIAGELPRGETIQGVGGQGEPGLLRAQIRSHALAFVALADAAVAPVALLELYKGFEQARAVEIGPKRFRNENLRIGDLPQQE